MEIYVKVSDESTFMIKVEANSTILDLKVAIQEQKGIAQSQQYLNFDGELLEDERTLSSYGIQQDSTILILIFPLAAVTADGLPLLEELLLSDDSGTASECESSMLYTSIEGDSDSDSSVDLPASAPARQPIPAEVVQIISRLCKEHSVESAFFMQDPADWKSIVITGVNVSRIESEIRNHQAAFPDLTIDIQEQDSPLFTKQLTGLPIIKVEKKSPTTLTASTWTADEWATTELFMSADEKNKDELSPQGAVYAVLPAHLVMNEKQRVEYADVDSMLAFARNDVEGETTRTRYTATAFAPFLTIDLKHPPLFSYRHWFSENSSSKFMNDLALLQLDQCKAELLQHRLKLQQQNGNKKIKEISSNEALQSMCERNQRVVIADAEGVLVPFPQHVVREEEMRDKKCYCLHLPFILTSKSVSGNTHELEPGQCGSILYYKSSHAKLLAMGLFVGKLKITFRSGNVVYQAIILSEALKDIERDYPYQLANIQLLKDRRRERQPPRRIPPVPLSD